MKAFIPLLLTFTFLAFQNCSETSFSDTATAQSKLAGDELGVGPDIDNVMEEDRAKVHEYYRCKKHKDDDYDDEESYSYEESYDDSDDSYTTSHGKKNHKVALCHNGHEICISENALYAHLVVHGDRFGDKQVDNYGDCPNKDNSEDLDDDESDS